MDVNRAYHIAGLVVATHHSQFHRLDGQFALAEANGLESVIKPDPQKVKVLNDGSTLKKEGGQVENERLTLMMAGRQAELIHFTLNAPAQLDFQPADLNVTVPLEVKADPARLRQRVTEALRLVTRNWREVECLAAWLTRQDRKIIPSAELVHEINGLGPDDHGLFP